MHIVEYLAYESQVSIVGMTLGSRFEEKIIAELAYLERMLPVALDASVGGSMGIMSRLDAAVEVASAANVSVIASMRV
jgi:hypothetical protein